MATRVAEPQDRLLTIEEYEKLTDGSRRTELVRGRIVSLDWPTPWHGYVCATAACLLGNCIDACKLGSLCSGCGVITQRGPDTVRGADVVFYSARRVRREDLAHASYLTIPPDLVFEVHSPGDSWDNLLAKIAEYLDAGVNVVCVLDTEQQTATVYEPDPPERTLTASQELTFPTVLPGFSVLVEQFFN